MNSMIYRVLLWMTKEVLDDETRTELTRIFRRNPRLLSVCEREELGRMDAPESTLPITASPNLDSFYIRPRERLNDLLNSGSFLPKPDRCNPYFSSEEEEEIQEDTMNIEAKSDH